jgi:hypothetical protein
MKMLQISWEERMVDFIFQRKLETKHYNYFILVTDIYQWFKRWEKI